MGFGAYNLDADNGNDIRRQRIQFRVGVEYYVTHYLALDMAGIYRSIIYDEVNGATVDDATAAR